MAFSFRRRNIPRLLLVLGLVFGARHFLSHFSLSLQSSPYHTTSHEILEHGVLERVSRPDKTLLVQKHKFLQVRMGRDETKDLFGDIVRAGVRDFWERFQKPQ
jgi:hypothetical protein